jgi:hypothetical protein
MDGPILSLINKLGTSCNLFEAFRRKLLSLLRPPNYVVPSKQTRIVSIFLTSIPEFFLRQKILGVSGQHVISRVFGVLLCALAIQFVFDGIG